MDGFDNLFAMEVDPNIGFAELPEEYFSGDGESEAWRSSKGVIQVIKFLDCSIIHNPLTLREEKIVGRVSCFWWGL